MRVSAFVTSSRLVGRIPGRRGLVVLFGVLTFLLSLTVAGLALLSGQDFFSEQKDGQLQVFIPAETPNWTSPLISLQGIRTAEAPDVTAKVLAVQQVLSNFPSILRVEPVQPHDVSIFPHSDEGERKSPQSRTFFSPKTIVLEAFFKRGVPLNLQQIQTSLQRVSPDITVEILSSPSALSVRGGMIAGGGLLVTGLILIVVLVTKAALRGFYATLDTLRLMGARNGYIAEIFQEQFWRIALWGGCIGAGGAALFLGAVFMALRSVGALEGAGHSFFIRCTGAVVAVPVVVALIGVLVSRLTVLRHLKQLDRL